ncbi:MAG: SPOR domain-containing protein [Pseudanabaena sp.]
MQTLSPTISPTITRKVNNINSKVADTEANLLPAIAHSSVLQTALSGLESSLNDELDRYRHWQANGQTISYLNPFRPRVISTQSVWASPSISEALLPPLEPPVDKRDQRTVQTAVQMPVMPPLANISTEITANQGLDKSNKPDNFSNPNTGVGIDNAFASTQTLNTYPNYAIASDANIGNVSSDNSSGNFSAGTKISEPDDDILQNFANDYANHYQNSINEESQIPIPHAPLERNTFRSLMNPVGIISLLLLLFSSAAIGYLLVDPSGVMKLFKSDNRPKSSQADPKSNDLAKSTDLQNQQQQKVDDSSLSFVPFVGDKNPANQTLEKLSKNSKTVNPAIAKKNSPTNPLSNPSNLFSPNSNSSLRTVPSTNLSDVAVNPLPPALAPLGSGYTTPERSNEAPVTQSYSRRSSGSSGSTSRSTTTSRSTYTEPANTYTAPSNSSSNSSSSDYVAPSKNNSVKYAAPLSASPVVTPENVAPINNGSYRVVVENGYGATAQQVERDAYVRPSDGQVQVGSYRDPNAAQQRIEQLRRQGIPAKIE